MSQELNLQDNPEGSSKDRKPVICRAASHPHLAPYCSHLPVAGCSHIREANSRGLLCAAHTHLSSQPMGRGWVRRWQKEPSGGSGTNPEAFRYSGEWQRQPVHAHRTWAWLTLKEKFLRLPCLPASPLQTFIRSQLFSSGCPLFTQGALRGARLRFAPWMSNCSFHVCFLFPLWGWIVWWLLRILFQWKLRFPRFLLIHECLVCALLTFYSVPSGGKARKNSQQDCFLLSDAGWGGQEKHLSAPFSALPAPLLYQGLLKAPAGSSLWIGNCVGKHLHSLKNHSQSPIGICYPWLVLTCSDWGKHLWCCQPEFLTLKWFFFNFQYKFLCYEFLISPIAYATI